MKAEREELLEAMGNALYRHRTGAPPKEFPRLRKAVREGYIERAGEVIKAAADRGYVLAKLPRFIGTTEVKNDATWNERKGWNACLDAIEIIELEETK